MKPIAEAVARWGNDWSIDRTIGPIADISHAADTKDGAQMSILNLRARSRVQTTVFTPAPYGANRRRQK